MTNRLAGAASPYLLQHADNPVDWWPWSEEAFAEARRRDVPVFLSVGYAACHWCHVMAHESFEDDATAAYLNEHFVSIKVDREERPDVDAVYMTATQAMLGQGGWPMSCFLTPDGDPFHCGTYFPPSPRQGMPSFLQVITAVAETWQQRGGEVRESAGKITEELAKHTAPLEPATVDDETLAAAVRTFDEQFDADNGGFGGAPKFPPSMVLEFLLRHHERTGSVEALGIVTRTLEAMARGGIYDQLAGGFARYSVDAAWVVPHFEKMLYDNALLLRAYAHAARLRGSALHRRVTEQTAAWLLDGLRVPEGAFAAALDADTAGAEGLTYVWTPAQLVAELGDEDGAWAAELLGVTEQGTFERGASTLRMPADPGDPERWERVRATLLAARDRRPQPMRDDKIVTEWNGLAITALAEAATALDRDDWLAAAVEAAEFLLRVHVTDDGVLRTSRGGVAGTAAGVLPDYGCLAQALLSLHQATGQARWLASACELLDAAVQRFHSDAETWGDGVWHDTAHDAERLITRPADPTDNATPSGAATVAEALLTASVLADPDRAGRYGELAAAAVHRAGALAGRVPRFAGHWLSVAEAARTGPVQVAVAGTGADADALRRQAAAAVTGGSVVVAGEPDADGVPLLAGRSLVDGSAAAYVCRGFVCDRPATDPEELRAELVRQQ